MSYIINVNSVPVYIPLDDKLSITSATINQQICSPSTLVFEMTPNNKSLVGITNRVEVYKDSTLYWRGFVSNIETTFLGYRRVTCTSMLGYLSKSITPQWEYKTTISTMINGLINRHNTLMLDSTDFPADSLAALQVEYLNNAGNLPVVNGVVDYDITLEALQKEQDASRVWAFSERYNGNASIVSVYNWGVSSPKTNQTIAFGDNLLDYARTQSADIVTGCIPQGAIMEHAIPAHAPHLEARVGVETVNDGKDYVIMNTVLQNDNSRKFAVVTFDNIDNPDDLLDAATEWLRESVYGELTYDVTAVDLAELGIRSVDKLEIGHWAKIMSAPFNLETELPIVEKSIDLLSPERTTITLSKNIPINFTKKMWRELNGKKDKP